MQKVTYINEIGQSVSFGTELPFLLESIDGVGALDVNLQMTKAPYQEGSTYIDSKIEPRALSLVITIMADTEKKLYEIRRLISRYFNPKIKGILIYENDFIIKQLPVVVDQPPYFVNDKNMPATIQKCLISLVAPMPFWEDLDETIVNLVSFEGGLSFPIRLPSTFSRQSASQSQIIENFGDVNTPVIIRLLGPSTGPITISNETAGKSIVVKQDLLIGETLEINTAFANKRVEKVASDGSRQNAFNYIEYSSTFWNLVMGNNLISYQTGQSGEKASMQLSFRNRFVGI